MLIDEIEKKLIELKIKELGIPEKKITWLNKLRINMIKIMEEINRIKKKDMNTGIFEKINLFLDFMKYKNVDCETRTVYIYHFLKKIMKRDIKKDVLLKLPLRYTGENITPLKFLNKLFRK